MVQDIFLELIMLYLRFLEKSDGLPTGAVSGFCSMLFKLLEDARSDDTKNKPTHFAVIFDLQEKILEMKFTVNIKLIEMKPQKILHHNLSILENRLKHLTYHLLNF